MVKKKRSVIRRIVDGFLAILLILVLLLAAGIAYLSFTEYKPAGASTSPMPGWTRSRSSTIWSTGSSSRRT